jgi:hypothetical protein
MSTSFPFLYISKQLSVPYAEVLRIADRIERGDRLDLNDKLNLWVQHAFIVECDRRAKVLAEPVRFERTAPEGAAP